VDSTGWKEGHYICHEAGSSECSQVHITVAQFFVADQKNKSPTESGDSVRTTCHARAELAAARKTR
jgi:hypothetical protein